MSQHLTISGICGSGIIEVLAEMYLAGIITPEGQVNGNIQHPRIEQDGRVYSYMLYDGHFKENDVTIRITQNDVRAIQLAKSRFVCWCATSARPFGNYPN